MTIYKIMHNNSIIEFNTLVGAESYASLNNLDLETITQEERESSVDLYSLIDDLLKQKQDNSLSILRETFVKNTLEGISTAQSRELFEQHVVIIVCVLVGAFPTALNILNDVQPSGFLTQERLDTWKALLAAHI